MLFNHASTADSPHLPSGSEVGAVRMQHYGGERRSSIIVVENVPARAPEPSPGCQNFPNATQSKPTLRLDRDNVAVHSITSVAYSSVYSPVLVHRRVKDDDEW